MKLKRLLTLLSVSFLMSGFLFLKPARAGVVKAEGEEQQEVVQTSEEKDKSLIETLVAPLLIAMGSINVTAVATTAVLFVVRHRKEIKMEKREKELMAKVESLSEENEKLRQLSSEAISKALVLYDQQLIESKREAQLLKEANKNCKHVEELTQAILLFTEIEIKKLSKDPEAIKNGLVKEIKLLEESVSKVGE